MSANRGYHAHVYYDAETKAKAVALRDKLIGQFKVEAGAFSDPPIGPHPISQFNVMFETPEFQNVVPWLMLNRDGLDVLVHPLTDSSYNDHTAYAMWLGAPVALKTDTLRHAPVPDRLLPRAQRQSTRLPAPSSLRGALRRSNLNGIASLRSQ
jgi:aromatic ring-cleaving dioxygenase